LQGPIEAGLANQGHGCLQVVTLLAGNPDLLALDRGLDFQLGILD